MTTFTVTVLVNDKPKEALKKLQDLLDFADCVEGYTTEMYEDSEGNHGDTAELME